MVNQDLALAQLHSDHSSEGCFDLKALPCSLRSNSIRHAALPSLTRSSSRAWFPCLRSNSIRHAALSSSCKARRIAGPFLRKTEHHQTTKAAELGVVMLSSLQGPVGTPFAIFSSTCSGALEADRSAREVEPRPPTGSRTHEGRGRKASAFSVAPFVPRHRPFAGARRAPAAASELLLAYGHHRTRSRL